MRRLVLSSALVTACVAPVTLSRDHAAPPPVVVAAPPAPPPTLLAFVQKSNPQLATKEAERVARLVQQVAEENDIEVPLFAAIVRQESHFKSGAKSCRNYQGIRRCDYGLAQVNSFWVDELELDAARLRNDDHYNLTVAAKILKDVLTRHPAEMGYAFYNSADPEMRIAYTRKIEKYRAIAVAMAN